MAQKAEKLSVSAYQGRVHNLRETLDYHNLLFGRFCIINPEAEPARKCRFWKIKVNPRTNPKPVFLIEG